MRGPRYVRSLAKDLRRSQTPAETILWDALRRKWLGVKFYPQRPSAVTSRTSTARKPSWSSNSKSSRLQTRSFV